MKTNPLLALSVLLPLALSAPSRANHTPLPNNTPPHNNTPPLVPYAAPFGGENLLSTEWRDWHHNVLTRKAAQDAGFFRVLGAGEKRTEDEIDSAAAEVGWHASFVDSYGYNPLFWVQGGGARIGVAMTVHDELVKVHFDDLPSLPQVRWQYFQYTTGCVNGLYWAKSLFDRAQTEQERKVAIGAARHILGISLHGIQDFYSHSNWVDEPSRRESTWFAHFAQQQGSLFSSAIYTGAYEHPDNVAVHSHGVISPMLSALQPIAGFMDIASGPFSPVHDAPIMDMWRKSKNRTLAIQPGILPTPQLSSSFLEGLLGGQPRPLSEVVDGFFATPNKTLVGVPPNLMVVSPPGIALDATYLRDIAVRQRGLVTNATPPDQARKIADTVFLAAYRDAYSASYQWLMRLNKIMAADASARGFWGRVKTDLPTGTQTQQFENANLRGYEFISSGTYPPPSSAVDSELRSNGGVPKDQYFLRVKLKTSTEALSGTDADIYLRTDVDNQKFLLDQAPLIDRTNRPSKDKSLLEGLFVPNDFEAGSEATYLVGPFSRLPRTLTLENDSGDAGQVLLALVNSFGQVITDVADSIIGFFKTLLGSEPDYVGDERFFWTWRELNAIGSAPVEFSKQVTNRDEGTYIVSGKIWRTRETATDATFRIQLTHLRCVKESTVDQPRIGFGGDEPFLIAALSPLPGEVRKARSDVFIWAHDNQTTELRRPANGNEKLEFDKRRTGAYYFDFDNVTVPKNYGAIGLPFGIWESDDDSDADRVKMMNKFSEKVEGPARTSSTNFVSELGRAVAPDWKLEHIQVTGFSKGNVSALGTLLDQRVDRWIPGKQTASFSLAPSLTAVWTQPLELQKLLPELQTPLLIQKILPIDKIKIQDRGNLKGIK